MPAQPLNPAQRADAERLRSLFKAWQRVLKDEGKNSSQEALAPLFGFGQSALSQYLNGGIPLNVGVLAKFAEVLGCAPSDISPDLSAQMDRFASVLPGTAEGSRATGALEVKAAAGSSKSTKAAWPFTRIREDDVRSLSPDDRSVVEGALALAIAQVGLKLPVADALSLSRRDQAAAIIRDASTTAANDADYIAIRKVAIKIAAGIAGFDTAQQRDDGTGGSLYLARQWVEKHRYRWQALLATTVKRESESMLPSIKPGDIVVFNTDDTTHRAEEVFAVNHEGEFTLKRLKKRLGHWWLYSDNQDQKRYPPVMCTGLTFIIGKIVLMQSEQL